MTTEAIFMIVVFGIMSIVNIVLGYVVVKYNLWQIVAGINTTNFKGREELRDECVKIVGNSLIWMGVLGVLLTGVYALINNVMSSDMYAFIWTGILIVGVIYLVVASKLAEKRFKEKKIR